MELIPLTSKNRKDWDEFCLLSPDAWFWHTTDWLDFNLAYRLELNPRPLSFLCVEGKRILAVAPLLLTHHEQDSRKWKAFTLSGNPIPSPALLGGLTQAKRDDILDFIFNGIDDLAKNLGVYYSYFLIEALRPSVREPRYAPNNFLLQHNYIDRTINTQLIDLRLSSKDLLAGLRRNHRRSIERGRKLFQIKTYFGAELTNLKFDEYVEMHARAAGRRTRSRATFDMMRTWIQSGRGFMVEAQTIDGNTAGFELYLIYKDAAYGLSACNEPDYEHLPVRHLIEWCAMIWMRDRGVRFYEIGEQHFGFLPYDFPDQKLQNISHFKYGFGGVTVPSIRAERFYSAEHWLAEQQLRNERFEQSYRWESEFNSGQGRALLHQMNQGEANPTEASCSLEELAPIPETFLELARTVLRDNPEAVHKFTSGNDRVLSFLVGQALRASGPGQDPLVMRRAIEWCLAQKVSEPSCSSRNS